MPIKAQVFRRSVKRVRLEFSPSGLKVIVPKNYNGDIKEILLKHKVWIAKRASSMAKYQQQVESLPIDFRDEVELQKIISGYLLTYQSQMQVQPLEVKYRLMKARWGSCNHKKVLTFNKNLKFLPEELICYVVVHELSHLRYMNHSKVFWQLVSQFIPNFLEARNRLKLYGFALNK